MYLILWDMQHDAKMPIAAYGTYTHSRKGAFSGHASVRLVLSLWGNRGLFSSAFITTANIRERCALHCVITRKNYA